MPNISDSDLPGLAAPAQRALIAAGAQHLEQSMKFSDIEGKQWHGTSKFLLQTASILASSSRMLPLLDDSKLP
jgi:hypothetical protein